MNNLILKKSFYTGTDTLAIAKGLLGKKLVTSIDGNTTAGIICETEAYCGTEDRGCHAFNGRLTDRTRIMYAEGGVSYVYLCYGVHYLFNVVTHVEGQPHAVLIRAIQPVDGLPTMLKRRKKEQFTPKLAAGPGLVAECLGLTTKHNGISLLSDTIHITNAKPIPPEQIVASPRVGMNFNGPYKLIPWRFRILHSPFTSPAEVKL
jgi:DNA-3-methyladenine glycosylase